MNDYIKSLILLAMVFLALLIGLHLGYQKGMNDPICKQPSYSEIVRTEGQADVFRTVCSNGVIK